jgi:hypothetical protein
VGVANVSEYYRVIEWHDAADANLPSYDQAKN